MAQDSLNGEHMAATVVRVCTIWQNGAILSSGPIFNSWYPYLAERWRIKKICFRDIPIWNLSIEIHESRNSWTVKSDFNFETIFLFKYCFFDALKKNIGFAVFSVYIEDGRLLFWVFMSHLPTDS